MKANLMLLLSAPFLVAATSAVQAQDYPTKNIQIIVPYSAGGGGDTVARIVADRLGEELGQQVNVVNREGAGGEIGIDEIARSEADGYTLGVFGYPDNFVLEHTRDTNFTFDSFDYLAAFDDMPMGVFSSPSSQHSSLEELVSYGQEHPGEMIIGESGALGLLHALAFAERSDMQITPIRYSGGGELMNALLGNHIDLASTSSMSHDPIVDSNGKPIGFASEERMEMFPDVPTFKEQGLDLVMGVSRVLVAPEGLPDDVRKTLVDALNAISTNEEMIANFENAKIPYRYLDDSAVNETLEKSNSVLMPVIENNLDQINGN
ncbi:tripartite tricarboxylate transporter substrate binding protein [Halomonas sp. SpR1]|uniref:Bug family tripartite tricarboxylate transporter substrate binding protein n=1 Tax=Halomonas sp. SpR1 TaxID=3050462 RepID=UPI0027E41C3C|nr:tripartite tricarboxylate transporter substrate binding protein [Halomonas sp. SpR1]MDQ7732473.1 tripartite tricarboxylate transporter substrate binding protein [Halomonas sp. SpR1]